MMGGDAATEQGVATVLRIDRAVLQQELTLLNRKNVRHFVVGIVMIVLLFIIMVALPFMRFGASDAVKAVMPIFGSSAALLIWKMFKTRREKSYTDCVLALVPSMDEDTLKTIIGVLVKKI